MDPEQSMSPRTPVERMLKFDVPEDEALLAAFGEVGLRHEHLNHILRMTIRTLANLEIDEAIDATLHDSPSTLHERVRKLARQRLGEGHALLKVQALIGRCRRLTDKRNEYVHSVWARELDGPSMRRDRNSEWLPLPTLLELQALSSELLKITGELNKARLEGFIFQAMSTRGNSKA